MSPATDWFVAPDAGSGDGSREKPFHDPWLALHAAAPGDVIHIAAGTYYGRYDRASWIIDSPRLTLRGGYARDFSQRTPWQTPSVFAVYPGYEAARENNLLSGRADHSGLVLDGLFFDASARNTYGDKPLQAIRGWPSMEGPIASFNAREVTIRNCVFANSANGGLELSGDASRFENNLVVNIIGTAMLDIRSSSAANVQPIVVAGNTFCFAHDPGPPCGAGGDRSIGVRLGRPAVVQDNVFVSCGNSAITYYRDADRIVVDRNLFHLTTRDIVNGRLLTEVDITEANLDELEDVGFKSSAGNVLQDPGLTGFRSDWLDAYSRHLLANYARPPREAANALRGANGLPALSPGDLDKSENKGDFALRLSPSDVLALRFTAKQGVHPATLAADFSGSPVQPPRAYRPIGWAAIDTPDPSLANQRVELRAGLGQEQNSLLLADAPPDTHAGLRLYRPGTDDNSVYVLAPRFTLPARQFDEAIRFTNGRDVETLYLVRGVYRSDVQPNSRQKVTLLVEAIVPAPFAAAQPPPRPAGRDWFVRAGSSGGDGSRDKPFRDPFQALDRAEGGDTIHVAAGDYFGKLHAGQWKLLIRNLSLYGGYDAEFSVRDPWKNPTRFLFTEAERAKGIPPGVILASEENSDGLILDGFIFDGATYNVYEPGGSLKVDTSPTGPLVDLRGGQSPITVRNCLFLNASGAAISIACPYGVFENNLLVNTSGWAFAVRADGPGPWLIRNNTFLFASDATGRASTGRTSSDGTLLRLSGRAVAAVDSNIFAFAEGFAVRCTLAQQNVSFDNNVFAANLYNHLTDAQYLWADSSTWGRRAVADSAFASFQGNSLDLPTLPVDPAFADVALARLMALPSRVDAEQWTAVAARVGSSVAKASEPAPTPAADSAPKEAPKPAAASGGIGDLLASLSSMNEQMKKIEVAKPAAAPAKPLFCPVLDWRKAIDSVTESQDSAPGAHRRKLATSFSGPREQAQPRQCTKLTAQAIDADPASSDNQSVELELTQPKPSSYNPAIFPVGTGDTDYEAYSVIALGDPTRTRLAVVVKRDTAVSKLLGRAKPTDKLRIRGVAHVAPGSLSIVVDSAEAFEG